MNIDVERVSLSFLLTSKKYKMLGLIKDFEQEQLPTIYEGGGGGAH